MTMLVIAAPGQGAQTPGFLVPWLELPGFADRLTAWSELAGCDLIKAGTVADADQIRDTAVAQPLLVAAAIAAAAAANATGMTALLGGKGPEVLAALDAHGLTPANINAAGQIVAAGTLEQLAALAADPPAGARLRPLSVAGAFHTSHMAPAVEALVAAAAQVPVSDPVLPLLSNRDGQAVDSGADWLERIVAQVSSPVRWDSCMAEMAARGATALIELPPAGTLAGLARRALPGIQRVSLIKPDDLEAARALLAEAADDPQAADRTQADHPGAAEHTDHPGDPGPRPRPESDRGE